jgi:hypothetical protein
MTDFDPFERGLAAALRSDADASVGPFNTGAIARTATDGNERPATRLPRALSPRARRFGRGRGIWLLAAATLLLVGGALTAGSGVLRRPSVVPPVTAPSPSDLARPSARPTPATPRLFAGLTSIVRNDLCPGATRLADIWDTTVAGNTMNHWTRGNVRPLDALGTGAVAIIVPVPGGTTEVRILDPRTSRSCLLLELPGGVAVADARWSPSGDALAIAMNEGGVYVWSAMGTTRPMVPDGGPLAWSPDGSQLAIGSTTGMWLLPNDGATPIQLHCDPPGINVECPAGPRLLWSPSGDRLVMAGGDRLDSSKYGPASTLDPVFHQIAVAPALEGAMPIGWLDSQTLVEGSDSRTFVVPVDDRMQPQEHALPDNWSGEPIFSPDQRLVAFGSFRQPVRVVDVASGREKVVIGATQLGTDLDYSVAWSSDSRSLVASVHQQVDGTWVPLGLWVLNADGSGLRKLISGQVDLVSTEDTDAQRAAFQSHLARALEGPAGSPGPP